MNAATLRGSCRVAVLLGALSAAASASTDPRCANVPTVAAWTSTAAAGDAVFLTGEGFTNERRLQVRVQGDRRTQEITPRWTDGRYLLATLPDDLPPGPLSARVGQGDCWSDAFPLNAPALWWAWPAIASPTGTLRLFGRDFDSGPVRIYLAPALGGGGRWLDPAHRDRYALDLELPADLAAGRYQLSLQTSDGDAAQHSDSVAIQVAVPPAPARVREVADVDALLLALDELTPVGGTIHLSAGHYRLREPLRIPAGVTLIGAGMEQTVLIFGDALPTTPGLVKPGVAFEKFRQMPDLLPGQQGLGARAAVLLFGSGSGLEQLTIDGAGVAEQGAAIAGTKAKPLQQVSLRKLRVHGLAPFQGAYGQTQAVLARHVRGLEVRDSELMGNGPALFLEDVADSAIVGNRLAGQGEGIVTVREGGIRHCVIENNRLLSKPDGAPQAIRAIWISTLFGSSYENIITGNVGADFHPPPGTDQNRGEAILFETALTHPYFGQPAGATADSVTLPHKGPDWTLLDNNLSTRGTRLEDYFVVVVDGHGQGQARRVIGRRGETLLLQQPWRVKPDTGSTVLITELFYRNLIVNNEIRDAMTGVQFWINGVENVIAGNRLTDFTAEGILLLGAASGGPQTQPPFWPIPGHNLAGFNRGIGPNYFNEVLGNTISGAQTGINISVGDFRLLRGPINWPLSMGNTVHGNVVEQSRGNGIWTGMRGKWNAPFAQTQGYSLIGNLIERNEVRQAQTSFGGDERSMGAVFRHNLVHPVGNGELNAAVFRQPPQPASWLIENNDFQPIIPAVPERVAKPEDARPATP